VLSLQKLRLCSINRVQFKDLVKFVCPQHSAIAKETIEKHRIFPLLGKKQQAMLIQEIGFIKFKKGSIIAREGEESLNLYILSKGIVASEMSYHPKV